MPKVTYLGKKDEMYAHGYDFSDGPVDVPDKDEVAIKKFEGNRYFFVDSKNNYVAPKVYVHDIQNIRLPNDDMGNPKFKRIRGSAKGKGFQTEKDAKLWIKTNGGKLDKTHYIKKSDEGIQDCSGLEQTKKPDDVKAAGLFKLTGAGKPYKKPEKVFEGDGCREAAEKWIIDEKLKPEEYTILVQ